LSRKRQCCQKGRWDRGEQQVERKAVRAAAVGQSGDDCQ